MFNKAFNNITFNFLLPRLSPLELIIYKNDVVKFISNYLMNDTIY